MEDISPLSGLGCTANDISGTVIIRELIGPPVCLRGDIVEVGLEITLTTTANTRYDVGIWVAMDGGNGLIGECTQYALQPRSADNLDVDLISGDGPFFNAELGELADLCGDTRATDGVSVTNLEGVLVPVLCFDSNSNNNLDADICYAWSNGAQTGTPCLSGLDALPTQKSKCNCQPAVEFSGVVVGDPPLAVDDEAGLEENGTVCVPVLLNDIIGMPNGAPFNVSTLELCSEPMFGEATIIGPLICYQPVSETLNGTDSFCYTICSEFFDGTNFEFCTNATVTINVGTFPSCQDDFAIGSYGITAFVDVASNDMDSETAMIDPSTASVPIDPPCGVYSGTTAEGLVQLTNNLSNDGNCTFIYRICTTEFLCVFCEVTVEFRRGVECAPDMNSTVVNAPITTPVIDNDIDYTYPIDPSTVSIIVPPSPGGTITNIDTVAGSIEFTPPMDTFGIFIYNYEICDTIGLCSVCAVTITVNEPPTCSALGPLSAETNGTLVIDVIPSVVPGTIGGGVIDPSSVTVTIGPFFGIIDSIHIVTGEITYVPDTNYAGFDNFTYSICQLDGQCCSNIVSILVHEGPMCMDDFRFMEIDSIGNLIDVLENDMPGTTPLDPSTVNVTTPPTQGTIDDINPTTGVITYTPASLYVGADSFIYEICDENALCCEANVVLSIITGPQAVNDTLIVQSGIPMDINPSLNDVAGENPLDITSCTILSGPDNGMTILSPTTCEITYTSDALYFGPDLIEYEICDTTGPLGPFCDIAYIHIEVLLGPTAIDDEDATTQNIPVTIDVLANDEIGQAPLDPSTTVITDNPDNGIIISVNPITGSVDYQPNSSFCGVDMFIYEICDTFGCCDSANVTITIDCPPIAVDDGATPTQGVEMCIDVLFNDIPGTSAINASTVSVCVQPVNGTAVVQPNGEICYTSNVMFSSPPNDDFTYSVTDENGFTSNCANVEIIVLENPMMGTTIAATTVAATTTIAGTTVPATTTIPGTTVAATTVPADNVTGTCTGHIFNDLNGNQVQDTGSSRALPHGGRGAGSSRALPHGGKGAGSSRALPREEKGAHVFKRIVEFDIPGVTITLLDACGVLHMATSDNSGDVILPGVCPGPAVLTIIVPDGMELTTLPNPRNIIVPDGNGTHSLFPPESSGFGIRTSSHLSTSQVAFVIIFGSLLGVILIGCCGLLGCIWYKNRRRRRTVIRERHAVSKRGKHVRVIDIWRNVEPGAVRQLVRPHIGAEERKSFIRVPPTLSASLFIKKKDT